MQEGIEKRRWTTSNGFLGIVLMVELVVALMIGNRVTLKREQEDRLMLKWYQSPSETVRLDYLRERRTSKIYGWVLVGCAYVSVAALTAAIFRKARRKDSNRRDSVKSRL